MTGSHEANGSIPFSSTIKNKRLRRKLKTSFFFLAYHPRSIKSSIHHPALKIIPAVWLIII